MDAKTLKKGIKFLVFAITFCTCIAANGDPSVDSADSRNQRGTVWTWGGNIWGELGHRKGTIWPLYGGRYKPVPISAVGTATEVAAGYFHSIALDANGSVWTWGQNDDGELGIGSKTESGPPNRIPDLEGVRAIAAGQFFSVAVMKDGTVNAWGSNYAGQLGDGTTEDRVSPVRVPGINDVKAVAAGRGFTVGLKHDGTVWAWGYNGYGQLGDRTKENRSTPVKLAGLDHVKAIDCGDAMTLALKEDGTVWSCGHNRYGNLGDGTETDRSTPVQIKGLEGVVAIACGGSHALAIRNDATVWAWGYGYKGELGMGKDVSSARGSGPKRNIAGKIPELRDIKAVAAGWDYSVALAQDGTLWVWGRNWNGQFGMKGPSDSLIPIKVSGISGIEAIDCGMHHTVAIRLNPTQ